MGLAGASPGGPKGTTEQRLCVCSRLGVLTRARGTFACQEGSQSSSPSAASHWLAGQVGSGLWLGWQRGGDEEGAPVADRLARSQSLPACPHPAHTVQVSLLESAAWQHPPPPPTHPDSRVAGASRDTESGTEAVKSAQPPCLARKGLPPAAPQPSQPARGWRCP